MNSQALESLSARLRRCVKIAGSGDDLARITAIPRRTLESYLTGDSEPKAGRLAAIAEATGVTLDWLVRGKGPMRLGQDAPAPAAPAAMAEAAAPSTDARLMGRLVEKILAVYKEMGVAIAIHQATERAAREHDRIVAAVADPDDRLTEVGEVTAALRQELRAKAADPASSKRPA